ncbi:PqqD family protein [Croceicoccus naphthovorans]|uniref:Uncharacterized protein n=1 Tax=Croceicoccus naphthovorans TaxID=1348774 RepID=A0A0G3XEB9_9SPHN|nr:PqqD family protein [Croceicoccus naphthovorans]AKM08954.1 hypothetical protein AB433_01535 [Croceicoccus naphthovorans]MBB3989256.1 hypothetical protein [Croceicoccus naphthovorans]
MLNKCPDRFVETEIDGEALIMDLSSGDFLSLAGTGLSVWRMIDGTRNSAAIAAELAREYDAPEPEIAADVSALIADLRDAGLIRDG